jgi:hypothetical protein
MGVTTHSHLREILPHFGDDKSPKGGNLSDPRGIEIKNGRMTNETPIGQVWKWKEAWKKVFLMRGGCQSVVYPQDDVKPSQDKTNDRITRQIINGTSK